MNFTQLMKNRTRYYILSLILIVPGLIALMAGGLRVGIDFTGGSLLEVSSDKTIDSNVVKNVILDLGFENVGVVLSNDGTTAIIRTRELIVPNGTDSNADESEMLSVPLSTETTPKETLGGGESSGDTESAVFEQPISATVSGPLVSSSSQVNEKQAILNSLQDKYPTLREQSFESIGPIIGNEMTKKAIISVIIAALAIITYVAFAFRSVPAPASSWRFGASAISALVHDLLFVLGSFALLGFFFDIEIDSMFVVALLTILGFSVHDSIVVFDRIREKLNTNGKIDFEAVVNESILETFARSINTSTTLIVTLLALLLFGGDSIFNFILALLLGVSIGTYSSLFHASPVLVDWQKYVEKKERNSR